MKIKKKKSQKCVSQEEHLNLKVIKTIQTVQIENKINYIEKCKGDVDSLKEDHKKLINKKLILKTKHNKDLEVKSISFKKHK